MQISIIAAIGKNNELGKDGKLLWSLPLDMKHFKNLTSGHVVIMGRKTFESIGHPLPNRKNIIITRNNSFLHLGHNEDITIVNSIDSALKISKTVFDINPEMGEVFVIGGAEIYKEVLPFVNKLYLTRVDGEFDADVFFPEFNENKWKLIKSERHQKDERHKYNFSFKEYQKKF